MEWFWVKLLSCEQFGLKLVSWKCEWPVSMWENSFFQAAPINCHTNCAAGEAGGTLIVEARAPTIYICSLLLCFVSFPLLNSRM